MIEYVVIFSCLLLLMMDLQVCQIKQAYLAVFYLAISNMAQRHVAFCERHVALHEHHVALQVRHVALQVRHVVF